MAKRIAGHGLKHEGRRFYDEHGHYQGYLDPDDKRATHGKCQCGLLFKESSDSAVRRAHREHKEQVRLQSGGAA